MKTKYTQHEIKCAIANTKRIYFRYLKMSETNDSKFLKIWIEDLKNEYNELVEMISDKKWVKDCCINLK
mgnify:CR=1 FL=1|tara:strand:+ start:319 stop:525 length:207 start_codon:yes stop_codon:yes gene_type:complete